MNQRQDAPGSYDPSRLRPRLFADRAQAGARLADQLGAYKGRGVLVLGVARGGVPVAAEVAKRLAADLDVIVARKIGAPHQQELAVGAITADGTRILNRELIDLLGVSDAALDRLSEQQRDEAIRRERRFRRGTPRLDPNGRIVIVVDDGLATGATMRAAIQSLRVSEVERLIVAVPVGAVESCAQLEPEVDELVCPNRPEPFLAVGTYYRDFAQTSDEEVERLLALHRRRNGTLSH
jgi:putative phosphoribosyl transferase